MKTKYKIILIIVMCIVGTCMHFVCDIVPEGSLRNILGIIFPFNETTWEHMKMIWMPFLAAGVIIGIKKRDMAYLSGFVVSGITAMLIQLGVFSLYQSFTGTSVLSLDIIFYMADMILCAMLGLLLAGRKWARKTWIIWLLVAVIVTAGIVYLTFNPGSGYVFLDDTTLNI